MRRKFTFRSCFLNGTLACDRPYGYSNFYVCCDGLLKYGEVNEITVKVNNSEELNSRWYSGSRIYRDVKLIVGNKTHIDIDCVKIRTVSLNPTAINIEIAHTGGEVAIEIIQEGKVIAKANGDNINLEIYSPKLWDDEHPNLYQAKVTLLENGIIADEVYENLYRFSFKTGPGIIASWPAPSGLIYSI